MFWLIVGVVIGYFFKPQIDRVLKKTIRMLKNKDYHDNDSY